MRSMELKEIQNFSLEILKDVHAFCVENNINYSLAYGTLLGAIRHKGFIPWDDDVDIMMPRPDFERFFKLYPGKGKYHAAAPGQNYLAFGRVYDAEKTVTYTEVPWIDKKSGVWIDVFPIDAVPDNKDEFKPFQMQLNELLNKQIRRRKLQLPFSELNFKRKWKKLIKCFGHSDSLSVVLNKHISLMQKYEYGSTNHCSLLAHPWNALNEYFTLESLSHFTDAEFENVKLKIVADYDTVLTKFYGDYMQLPPEEKRVPQQLNYLQFYWL